MILTAVNAQRDSSLVTHQDEPEAERGRQDAGDEAGDYIEATILHGDGEGGEEPEDGPEYVEDSQYICPSQHATLNPQREQIASFLPGTTSRQSEHWGHSTTELGPGGSTGSVMAVSSRPCCASCLMQSVMCCPAIRWYFSQAPHWAQHMLSTTDNALLQGGPCVRVDARLHSLITARRKQYQKRRSGGGVLTLSTSCCVAGIPLCRSSTPAWREGERAGRNRGIENLPHRTGRIAG